MKDLRTPTRIKKPKNIIKYLNTPFSLNKKWLLILIIVLLLILIIFPSECGQYIGIWSHKIINSFLTHYN